MWSIIEILSALEAVGGLCFALHNNNSKVILNLLFCGNGIFD